MGGKGSGKVTSRKARLDRVKAGKIRAAQRYGKKMPPLFPKPLGPPMVPPAGDPPPALPLGPLESIADYDKLLGRPDTWTDAKKREEVQGEILLNEQKDLEMQTRRGRLFTREQVQDRETKHTEIIFGHLAKLAEFVAGLVEPERKDQARAAARKFITDTRTAVADSVKSL